MTRVAFTDDRVSVYDVWQWIETTRRSYGLEHAEVRSRVLSDTPIASVYETLTLIEIDDAFAARRAELDRAGSLLLVAAAEALLRVDYLTRVYRRRRDPLSRRFRAIYKRINAQARLDDDILAAWKSEFPAARSEIGQFLGLSKFRHWLAHGRYWSPKLGQAYDAELALEIIEGLFGALPADDDWEL